MRKRIILALILPFVLLTGYLYFVYCRFYNNIGDMNLQSPYKQNRLSLENSQKEGTIKYVALGDSLTAGVGSDSIESTPVYQVALKLSKQYGKVDVVNLGQPGATAEDIIVSQLDAAIYEQPDYVTLLIGINDMHNKVRIADYTERLVYILNNLLGKTNAQILLINLPYLGSSDAVPTPFSYVLNMRTRQFNKVIADVIDNDRVNLVDLYTPTYPEFLEHPEYYAPDRFHPSSAGYMFLGKIINAN